MTTAVAMRREGRVKAEAATGRVLLVESDPLVRELSRRVLAKAGHAVQAVADALEALRLLAVASVDVVVAPLEARGLWGGVLLRDLAVACPTARAVGVTRAIEPHTVARLLAAGVRVVAGAPLVALDELECAVGGAVSAAREEIR